MRARCSRDKLVPRRSRRPATPRRSRSTDERIRQATPHPTREHRAMTSPGARWVVSELTAALGKWHDAHPAVHRMWALEHSGAIHVVITLEPTPDGDDAMPAWLDGDGTIVAEFSWRDGWN